MATQELATSGVSRGQPGVSLLSTSTWPKPAKIIQRKSEQRYLKYGDSPKYEVPYLVPQSVSQMVLLSWRVRHHPRPQHLLNKGSISHDNENKANENIICTWWNKSSRYGNLSSNALLPLPARNLLRDRVRTLKGPTRNPNRSQHLTRWYPRGYSKGNAYQYNHK